MNPDEKGIHQAVFRALRAALCLSQSEADGALFRSWQDTPNAEPPRTQNLCYYALQTDPSAPLLQETSTEASASHADSFIPCRLLLTFYGPECESWAIRCRTFLFQDGASSPRRILRDAGLYPVPFPQPPSVLYEETGKAWRKRADLVIDLRLLDSSVYGSAITRTPQPVDTIETPPDVQIHLA